MGFLRSVVVTAALVCISSVAPTHALKEGEYFKPSAEESSGIPGTTAAYRRSPCPALNSLANHGYLPRDGKDITHDMFKDALMNVYNLGSTTAALLVKKLPETMSLDHLGTHNFLEHDASLAHADSFYGVDPMTVDAALAEDLFSHADEDGMLTTAAVAQVRKDRSALCEAKNPQCDFSLRRKNIAYLEASVFLLALGNGNAISVEHARSFIVEEKIPDDYEKPSEPVSIPIVLFRTGSMVMQSIFWAKSRNFDEL